MRAIERTTRFKRDFKRELRGQHRLIVEEALTAVITLLAQDLPLPPANRDHAIIGQWADHRDCHLRPDLILIYRKTGDDTLQLVRLGSHAELEL